MSASRRVRPVCGYAPHVYCSAMLYVLWLIISCLRELNQIRNIFKYIGYSCLNKECWHILYILGFRCHTYLYKHVIVVNMQVSLYNNISQPITSGNMHTQFEKCAYVRNHGYAPYVGACPHKGIPLHFKTYLFVMVGTVVSLLALWIYICSL